MSTKKPCNTQQQHSEKPNSCFTSWFVFITFTLSFLLLYLDSSMYSGSLSANFTPYGDFFLKNKGTFIPTHVTVQKRHSENSDKCAGKYIFVQELPREFNYELLENCSNLNKWINMCPYLANSGFGPRIDDSDQEVSFGSDWYDTSQFTVALIFHDRMKRYRCLTNDSSKASAIYVPFYAGLDVSRYLWNHNLTARDTASNALAEYLRRKPEWNNMYGRDHFLVAGRIASDFRRFTDSESDWGNRLFFLPEIRNMTSLSIESSPWSKSNFAVPYPTYFHPASDSEVSNWQNRIRKQKRPYLFSFAGAPRPQLTNSVRNEIIRQCLSSKGRHYCKFMKCDPGLKNCDKPANIINLFRKSVFCLQPPGDSYTRRSTFDAILAGCIPVFFHPGSAYTQYLWHLPRNYSSYSVFIPLEYVKKGNFAIEKRLLEMSEQDIAAMREEVIKLVPNLIYANPNSKAKTFEDAFDLSVKEVLNRVEKIRMEIKDGLKLTSESYPEIFSWKYNFFGGLENHEWDSYFTS